MRILLFFLVAFPVHAGDTWPEYRGPTRDGHSDCKGLPLKWSEADNVKWKTPIHGKAWSSPVVWGDQVWLTTATPDGKKMHAICVDRNSGKILLDHLMLANKTVRPLGNTINTYGSPSPVIEEGRVYIHFGSYGTACYDTKTLEQVWKRTDLPCHHWRGPASSPVLYKNLLICTYDGADHQYTAALNKQTGETVWKTDRSTDYGDVNADGSIQAQGDFRKCFNTPIVVPVNGKDQLISEGAKAVFGYDVASGEEIWTATFREHSSASRPVVDNGMAYINTGYGKPKLIAVPITGTGDVTGKIKWTVTANIPKNPSPVLAGGHYYAVDGTGIACCIELETGDYKWRERLDGKKYSASVLLAEGRVYCFSEEGHCSVFEAKPVFKKLAASKLDDGFMASPAAAGKALYLRTKKALYRIEE